jgi:hypothetical protein
VTHDFQPDCRFEVGGRYTLVNEFLRPLGSLRAYPSMLMAYVTAELERDVGALSSDI